jgi:hypothetical protein
MFQMWPRLFFSPSSDSAFASALFFCYAVGFGATTICLNVTVAG